MNIRPSIDHRLIYYLITLTSVNTKNERHENKMQYKRKMKEINKIN